MKSSQVPEVAREVGTTIISKQTTRTWMEIGMLDIEVMMMKAGIHSSLKRMNIRWKHNEQKFKQKQNIHLSHVYCTSSGALVVIIPGTCWSATVILKFTSLQFYFFDFRLVQTFIFGIHTHPHMWADMEQLIISEEIVNFIVGSFLCFLSIIF